jgi:hypothetical protein
MELRGKKKPSIFDGKLFRVKRQEFLLPRLVIDTCMSSFKEWIGTKRGIDKNRDISNIARVWV